MASNLIIKKCFFPPGADDKSGFSSKKTSTSDLLIGVLSVRVRKYDKDKVLDLGPLFFVLSSHQRRGVGSKLVDAAFNWARRREMRKAVINVGCLRRDLFAPKLDMDTRYLGVVEESFGKGSMSTSRGLGGSSSSNVVALPSVTTPKKTSSGCVPHSPQTGKKHTLNTGDSIVAFEKCFPGLAEKPVKGAGFFGNLGFVLVGSCPVSRDHDLVYPKAADTELILERKIGAYH